MCLITCYTCAHDRAVDDVCVASRASTCEQKKASMGIPKRPLPLLRRRLYSSPRGNDTPVESVDWGPRADDPHVP